MHQIVFAYHPPDPAYITLRPCWELGYVEDGVQQGRLIVIEIPKQWATGFDACLEKFETLPEYRRRGIALTLARAALERWPRCVVSDPTWEGERLVERLWAMGIQPAGVLHMRLLHSA
jgi:hypothetical protein